MNALGIATEQLLEQAQWTRDCVPILSLVNGLLSIECFGQPILELTKDWVDFLHPKFHIHGQTPITHWDFRKDIAIGDAIYIGFHFRISSEPYWAYIRSAPSEFFPNTMAVLCVLAPSSTFDLVYPSTSRPEIHRILLEFSQKI